MGLSFAVCYLAVASMACWWHAASAYDGRGPLNLAGPGSHAWSCLVLRETHATPSTRDSPHRRPRRWLFNAIAAPLPPIPNKDDKFNVRFERAEAKLADCIQQQENALWQERKVGKRRDDHTKALAIAAATPREKQNPQQRMMLANRAMNSPMWRARELRRNLRDDQDLAKAASDHAMATSQRAQAQMMVYISA